MTRRTLLFAGGSAGLIAVAGGIRLLDARRKAERAAHHGHGGVDAAIGDTEAQVSALPENRRLAFLLEIVRTGNVVERFAAIERLVERNEPAAIDAVADAYQDNFSRTRQRALENLHRLDPTRGIPLLYQGIRDNDLWLRETASQQLLVLAGDKKVRLPPGVEAALVAGLHDTSVEVRTTSSNALIKLTGQRDPAFRLRISTPPDAVPAMVQRWETYLAAKGAAIRADALLPRIEPTRFDDAPDYAFQTIDGASISRTSQRGKVTLLHFWGTWCGPCQTEMPDLQKAASEVSGGAEVFGLAIAEEKGETHLRTWCQERGITFPQSLDAASSARAFQDVVEVPASVLIDARGRVRYRWDGERDAKTYRASIRHVLDNA